MDAIARLGHGRLSHWAAPFSKSPTVRAVGLLGAMVHGAVGAIGATTAPIDRYMAPSDPLLPVAEGQSSGWNR